MLSISPSICDSYEYWRSLDEGEYADKKLAELVAQIKGDPFEPTPAMLLGRAWHKAIEDGDGQEAYAKYGFAFTDSDIEELLGSLPGDPIHELWGELSLPEIGVVMRLRVDIISGNEIHDVKTTEGQLKPARYMDSIQWRCYLESFNADAFVYHLCKLKLDKKSGTYGLVEHQRLRQYAYPGMRDDIVRRVGDCKAFIESQGLAQYRTIPNEEVT